MDCPGGPGPWFCGLVIRGGGDNYVVAHTMPHLSIVARDDTLVLKVGPFDRWDASQSFARLWTPASVERGAELAAATAAAVPHLRLWTKREHDSLSALHCVFDNHTTTTLVSTIKETHNKLKGVEGGGGGQRTKKTKKI